jgi:hypothetical protein
MRAYFDETVRNACLAAGFQLDRIYQPQGGGLAAHFTRPDGSIGAIDGTDGAARFAADPVGYRSPSWWLFDLPDGVIPI